MATKEQMGVQGTLLEYQSKYTYFLLASVGACLAFSLNQTTGKEIDVKQLPLAIAVIMWGISFFCGCQYIQKKSSILYANVRYLNAENYDEFAGPSNEYDRRSIMITEIFNIEKLSKIANKYTFSQFYLFISAVIFYIAWHILEMST